MSSWRFERFLGVLRGYIDDCDVYSAEELTKAMPGEMTRGDMKRHIEKHKGAQGKHQAAESKHQGGQGKRKEINGGAEKHKGAQIKHRRAQRTHKVAQRKHGCVGHGCAPGKLKIRIERNVKEFDNLNLCCVKYFMW